VIDRLRMVQLDDWVLCRIYKKTSHASPMAVPPLSDHEQDEPCGFDENRPYAASSAGMLVQSAAYPVLHDASSSGAPQRMPRIPSLTELFNDPSLAHFFEDGGVPDMARLDQHHQPGGGATLLGHPVTSQLLMNNGNSGLPGQMDSSASTSAAAGHGAASGNRKRSSETSTSASTASAAKKPNGSCFGATFQIGNGLQGSLGHHMLLHSNMGMN